MLTVVLANYNHARFLPFAFEALLAQTCPPEEAIIIDDVSTDNSVEVIERYLPRFTKAHFIKNPKNVGIVRNMNIGLEAATSDFVHFAAADDITYPTLYEKARKLLQQYPQAGLFSARSDIIDVDGNPKGMLPTPTPLHEPGFIPPAMAAQQLIRDDSWFMGNATVFRRSHTLAAGGFPEELQSLADGYICRLLALKHGACFSPEVLAAWRRMEGGVAWSYTVDLARSTHQMDLTERLMKEAGDVFPAEYQRRWRGRHLFAAQRFALVQARAAAKKNGLLAYAAALVREVIGTARLFASLRPADLGAVLSRRIRALWASPR